MASDIIETVRRARPQAEIGRGWHTRRSLSLKKQFSFDYSGDVQHVRLT